VCQLSINEFRANDDDDDDLPASDAVDAAVDGRHDDERQVEGSGGRDDGVDAVDVEAAVGRRVGVERHRRAVGEPAGVDRRERPVDRVRVARPTRLVSVPANESAR